MLLRFVVVIQHYFKKAIYLQKVVYLLSMELLNQEGINSDY